MGNIVYSKKRTICPQCGLRKRGFWATEFDFPCDDCCELNATKRKEEYLRQSVATGKIKMSDLTELGRKVVNNEI